MDFMAGLTVALVLIPQSMAYAQLAGLPPYYGLYASFLPPLIAALFGSSRQLATGPVAVVSLMTAASLEPLATAGSESFIAYAVLLALVVGVFQLCLGLLRLGLVVNFLSHPVVSGFTNAAAIIIATSQLSKMFGVSVDNAEHHYQTIMRVFSAAMHYTHWPTLALGVFAFAVMFLLKRYAPRVPNVLVAVALTTVFAWVTGFEHNVVIDVQSIADPQAQADTAQYNAAIEAQATLARTRTALTATIEKAKAQDERFTAVDGEHELSRIILEMDIAQDTARQAKGRLRAMLFEGVPGPEGKTTFYPLGMTPPDAQTDGRTWRIKVGNKALDQASLTMVGGGSVVGAVPAGLPSLAIPKMDLAVMLQLLPYAAIIALLGFMEAISIAKAIAGKTGQSLDPNQELIGQGLANILGAFSHSYPTSGSFSRSAVNLQAGAKTGFSSVFTTGVVVVSLLFFTPLLYHLPQCTLAAVIMMAVIGLIHPSSFVHAWKVAWYDGAISIISFGATLAFAPHLDKGIMIGVALSLGVFLYRNMRPMVSSLARTEKGELRDATLYGLALCPHVDVVRFNGPLFFANASFLDESITSRLQSKKKLKHIIMVAKGINDMDASGEEALSLVIDRCRSRGVDISLSGVNDTVMAIMSRSGLLNKLGLDHIYATVEKAICSVHDNTHQDSTEARCPLTTACRLNTPPTGPVRRPRLRAFSVG
ncbi:Sulfate permease [Desulfovibrio sp. TomC]|nr:Sulfate permease [Desulfovibrio sp. TomC]